MRSNTKNRLDLHEEDSLLALEQQLNSDVVRHDRAILNELIGDDFREFGSSGTIYTRESVIDALLASDSLPVSMVDFTVKQLSDSVYLTTYKALKDGNVSLRSSIWIRSNECWKIIFHQGTNVSR